MAVLTDHPLVTGCPPGWACAWGQDQYGPWCAFQVEDVAQRMRWIPPGRFRMGSPAREEGRVPREGPQHDVEFIQGFWLGDTPCTQALWTAVMGDNPSHFKGARRPVEQVSWEDCQAFIHTFNRRYPALPLTLPTEAQWEYACRAGTQGARYHEDLNAIAWYSRNSGRETHEVGCKAPNQWGLYDMLGNVDEWCHDGMREYIDASVMDPVSATEAGADRVVRGGGWRWVAQDVRAAVRGARRPGFCGLVLGFRCASSGSRVG